MKIGTTLATGVIEGLFGRPWSWAARRNAIGLSPFECLTD